MSEEELTQREKQLTNADNEALDPLCADNPPASVRLTTPQQQYRQLAAKLRKAGDEAQAAEFDKMAEQMEQSTVAKVASPHIPKLLVKPRSDKKKQKESQNSRDLRKQKKTEEQMDREGRARQAEEKAQRAMAENKKRRKSLIADKMEALQCNPPTIFPLESNLVDKRLPVVDGLNLVKAPKQLQQQCAMCPQCKLNIPQKDVVSHSMSCTAIPPEPAPAHKLVGATTELPPITQLKKQTGPVKESNQQYEPGPLTRRCLADAAEAERKKDNDAANTDKVERKRHKEERRKRQKDDENSIPRIGTKFAALKGQARTKNDLVIPSLAKHNTQNKERQRNRH